MDQTASLLCRSGNALFFDTRTLEVRQVPLDLEPAGLTLLVVNTGVKHALGNSAYADRVRDCRRAAQELGVAALRDVAPETMDAALAQIADDVVRRRARHVISEQSRVLEVVRLLESGRPAEVGPVLSAGHRSLRDDYEVSCAELDTVVDVAVDSGALGARMTGGGFGGSAVVLVGLARAEAVARAITEVFVARGYSPPQTMEIVACDGASGSPDPFSRVSLSGRQNGHRARQSHVLFDRRLKWRRGRDESDGPGVVGPAGALTVQLRERAEPTAGPGQIVIRVHACGVCHSQLHMIEGDWATRGVPSMLPIIPGHEVVGSIVEIGPGVEGLALGQRVGAQPLWSCCGRCSYCLTAHENLCPNKKMAGETIDGGFAEYMLATAEHVYPVPETSATPRQRHCSARALRPMAPWSRRISRQELRSRSSASGASGTS